MKECGLKDVGKNESPSVEQTDDGQKVIHCDERASGDVADRNRTNQSVKTGT